MTAASTPLHVVFRCDASPQIGSGHVMRCLTLADALREHGAECLFLASDETVTAVPQLNASGYDINHPDDIPDKADWLIIDHYGLDATYETASRQWADQIMVIDDLANRPHDCDLLLDQTFRRSAVDYKLLVPTHCHILTGTRHALLRPEFATMREHALERRQMKAGHVERILITLGGTNLHNITTNVLIALQGFRETPLEIDVVLGGASYYLADVQDAITSLNIVTDHNAALHIDVDARTMAELMTYADICIGAGGSTSWERCCLGLPTVMIVLADNQQKIARELHNAGAVMHLGHFSGLQSTGINDAIAALRNDKDIMMSMIDNASHITDGRGLEALRATIAGYPKGCFSLRPATIDDAAIILAWRNDPSTRQYSHNSELIDRETHWRWMNTKLNDPHCVFMVAQQGRQPVGTIRGDYDEGQDAYILSWMLSPSWRGQGYGQKLLAHFLHQLQYRAIAEIKRDNVASVKIAEKNNMTLIDKTNDTLLFQVTG